MQPRCEDTKPQQMLFCPQPCVTSPSSFLAESKLTQSFKCRLVVKEKALRYPQLLHARRGRAPLTPDTISPGILCAHPNALQHQHQSLQRTLSCTTNFFIQKAQAKGRSGCVWLYLARHLCGPLERSQKSEQTFHAFSASKCKIQSFFCHLLAVQGN